jgi:hypothetical protein
MTEIYIRTKMIRTTDFVVKVEFFKTKLFVVGDSNLDLHVFGPPGSGSISQRYGSEYFPFLMKVLSGLNNAGIIKF